MSPPSLLGGGDIAVLRGPRVGLGISCGASATRIAAGGGRFETVATAHRDHAELTIAAVRAALATGAHAAVAAAARNAQLLEAVAGIPGCEPVTEAAAALCWLTSQQSLGSAASVALFDLGASGLTVTVLDLTGQEIVHSARTTSVGGHLFDQLVRQHQVNSGIVAEPADAVTATALDTACEQAKVHLSETTVSAVPGPAGIVSLTRDEFAALIMPAALTATQFTIDTVTQAARSVSALVMIGGCSRIPVIVDTLRQSIPVPVHVAASPEFVIAEGAALLAESLPPAVPIPEGPEWLAPKANSLPHSRKVVNGKVIGVAAVALLGAAGIYCGRELAAGPAAPASQAPPSSTPAVSAPATSAPPANTPMSPSKRTTAAATTAPQAPATTARAAQSAATRTATQVPRASPTKSAQSTPAPVVVEPPPLPGMPPLTRPNGPRPGPVQPPPEFR